MPTPGIGDERRTVGWLDANRDERRATMAAIERGFDRSWYPIVHRVRLVDSFAEKSSRTAKQGD
jgi:hypothetical protein